jgi:sugar phosphate permease
VLDEYPEKSKFLTAEQRDIATRLIALDREEHSEDKITTKMVIHTLGDWKIWAFAVMYMLCVVTTYGISYFMPLILNGKMGYSGALSQVLSTPPYFYAFILAAILSGLSDHVRLRTPFIIFFSLNVVLGIILVRWGPNTGSQYLGLFLTLGGALINGPMIIIFGQNNAPTRTKRSVSSGLQLTLGAIGGIMGSTVFRSQDAPTYTPGVIAVLCCTGGIITLSALLAWHLHRQNQLRKETGCALEGQEGFLYTL